MNQEQKHVRKEPIKEHDQKRPIRLYFHQIELVRISSGLAKMSVSFRESCRFPEPKIVVA
jgi:hypothetical protein